MSMSSTKDEIDPLAVLGDDFAKPLHKDTYPAIDSRKVDLTGKSVFITGGSKGIGKATTLSFAKAGASFIAVGARSNLQSLEKAVLDAAASAGRKPPHFLPINLDITSKQSVDEAVAEVEKKFGKVDILINNAGALEPPAPVAETDPEIWWNTWVVNVRGPYLVTRAFLPLLLKGDSKQIVITASAGAFALTLGFSAYQTGKLALLKFAEFVDAEYGDKGILIYSIHPGAVLTEIFDSMGGLPEIMSGMFQDTPELAADTAVFLTSERREWLSGRYISCTWDMPEFIKKKDEIIKGDKLKARLAI